MVMANEILISYINIFYNMIFLPFSDDDNEAPIQVRLQSVSCDVIVRGFVAKIEAKLRYKNHSDRLLQVRK